MTITLDTVSEVIKYIKKHYDAVFSSDQNFEFKQTLYKIREACGQNEKLSVPLQDGTDLSFEISYIKKLRQWKLELEK